MPIPTPRILHALLAIPALILMLIAGTARADIHVTDIAGREVTLPAAAKHIVLGAGRHLAVLGLIHDDPVALVSGWPQARALDAPTLAAYRKKFPAIDQIVPVGAGNRGISAEAIIALHPDLVVLTLVDQNDSATQIAARQIEAAGIPVAYVDFFSQPLKNAIPSLRILGKLTGAEARAEEFAQFYETRLNRVRSRLADPAIPRPRVFFHLHAAPTGCCATIGSSVFDDFITFAGGQNIGAETVGPMQGNVSLEYLIGADPDFYIATGGTHMAPRGGLVLGSGVDAETAQDSFQALISAPGFSALRATHEGHAAGIWHLFNDSPAHIALVEYLAKSFHPDLFADVDPDATMAQIQARFAPVTVPGIWWVTPPK